MASDNKPSAPAFLTEVYLENILKKYLKDSSLKVLGTEAWPASGKGEGYCSIMTRMQLSYEIDGQHVANQINFIVKSTFDHDSQMFKIFQQYDIFNTEMEMYETVLPQLEKMLNGIGDSDQLAPIAIHVDRAHNVVILEDLLVREFAMANRFLGMDECHIKMCLGKLAKMHASAAVLNEKQNGSLEKYCHGIFNRRVNCYGIFFENMFRVCAKFAGTCPGLGIYYRDKLLNLIPYISEYATRCYDAKSNHFLTLNHGDMWTNNYMIQYHHEKGSPTVRDALLIDFQYCNWTSPAIDLHYLLNTSLQDDLVLNRQPELIQYYHSVLTQTLRKLKYTPHIPSLHELNVQLLERGFYAVTSLLSNFPLMANDKTDDADFECLVGSDERAQRFHSVLYANERVQRIVKLMLPRFDQMGLLDVV